ncbi:MAG: GAF domain-containing protein [Saprospiraceae bacterium]|nr:GAF domain-containing protein [Saprospiraceae bacterium]
MKATTTVKESPLAFKVSFEKIFDYWDQRVKSDQQQVASRAKDILQRISHAPELRKPFADLNLLDKYAVEVELLLSDLFSDLLQQNEIRAISVGLNERFFNETTRFSAILKAAGDDFIPRVRGISDDDLYLMTCTIILQKGFGVNITGGLPQLLDIPDHNGILKTYRGFFNADFMELVTTEKSPKLTQEQIAKLLDNADDLTLWKQLIPPNSFEMHGFGIMTLFDISADDAISTLKDILIRKDALVTKESLASIQHSLRRILRVDDLKVGFGAITDGEFYNVRIEGFDGMLMAGQQSCGKDAMFCKRSFDTLFQDLAPITFSDIEALPAVESPLLKRLVTQNVESYFITPLNFGETPIGFMEIGSPTSNSLNSTIKKRMQDLVPLFSTALKRSLDEYHNTIDAIIKEKCTSIHPSVEWRFRQAAGKVMKSGKERSEIDMEEIVFQQVIPLYGQLDIRGSSRYRNESIKADLSAQLNMAKQVLQEASATNRLLAYDQLMHIIDKNLYRINDTLGAGDEASILNFIHSELDPVFEYLDSFESSNKALVKYRKRVDPALGMVYEKRKQYEAAVTQINDLVGVQLEHAQQDAQAVFPHYFEKYKTDGVEFNLYIGQSLARHLKYHPIHLKNLRLWQLVTMCDVDLQVKRLKKNLAVPLEVAPLILVQDNPLDIKFRMDEKQFDVDGAYNVRYEIIKKRIDKAKIKDANERLTQPGKLAIVYSTNQERNEYLEFFDFLISKSYILPETEDLLLEELDGASGLRALRVTLNYERNTIEKIDSKATGRTAVS